MPSINLRHESLRVNQTYNWHEKCAILKHAYVLRHQAPVVQKMNNAIHRISINKILDSDLSGTAIHLLNNWGQANSRRKNNYRGADIT